MLNELHGEAALQGFQPVGVVFDPPNDTNSHGELVPAMVDYFKLTYRWATLQGRRDAYSAAAAMRR